MIYLCIYLREGEGERENVSEHTEGEADSLLSRESDRTGSRDSSGTMT